MLLYDFLNNKLALNIDADNSFIEQLQTLIESKTKVSKHCLAGAHACALFQAERSLQRFGKNACIAFENDRFTWDSAQFFLKGQYRIMSLREFVETYADEIPKEKSEDDWLALLRS